MIKLHNMLYSKTICYNIFILCYQYNYPSVHDDHNQTHWQTIYKIHSKFQIYLNFLRYEFNSVNVGKFYRYEAVKISVIFGL